MSDDLTNSQIALLCAIEEHDHSNSSSDQKRDLEALMSGGYVQATRTIRARPFSSRPRVSRFSANAALG